MTQRFLSSRNTIQPDDTITTNCPSHLNTNRLGLSLPIFKNLIAPITARIETSIITPKKKTKCAS